MEGAGSPEVADAPSLGAGGIADGAATNRDGAAGGARAAGEADTDSITDGVPSRDGAVGGDGTVGADCTVGETAGRQVRTGMVAMSGSSSNDSGSEIVRRRIRLVTGPTVMPAVRSGPVRKAPAGGRTTASVGGAVDAAVGPETSGGPLGGGTVDPPGIPLGTAPTMSPLLAPVAASRAARRDPGRELPGFPISAGGRAASAPLSDGRKRERRRRGDPSAGPESMSDTLTPRAVRSPCASAARRLSQRAAWSHVRVPSRPV